MAIDRNDVNETVYMGRGVPGQFAPISSCSFYANDWRGYYARYDPALADKLLDEPGLDKRGKSNYRLRPDGKALSIVIEFSTERYTPALELVREYWEAVGLKTTIKLEDTDLITQRMGQYETFSYIQGNVNIPWCNERDAFQNVWTWSGGAIALPGSAG